jgi:hypothetical protein
MELVRHPSTVARRLVLEPELLEWRSTRGIMGSLEIPTGGSVEETALHVGHPEVDENADGASRTSVRSDVDGVRPVAEPRADEHAAPDVVLSLDAEVGDEPKFVSEVRDLVGRVAYPALRGVDADPPDVMPAGFLRSQVDGLVVLGVHAHFLSGWVYERDLRRAARQIARTRASSTRARPTRISRCGTRVFTRPSVAGMTVSGDATVVPICASFSASVSRMRHGESPGQRAASYVARSLRHVAAAHAPLSRDRLKGNDR